MRRGHGQRSPATDIYFITIGTYHDAPLNADPLNKILYLFVVDRDDILKSDPIYCYHPSGRRDL
jgi:hypothetical protein